MTEPSSTDPESIMIEIEVDASFILPEEGDAPKVATVNEVDKHRENIRTLLLCTNATPIGRYASRGYHCCFCTELYSKPKDLKTHIIEQHDEENISTYMNNYTLLNYIVKLDITGLRCKMCTKPYVQLQGVIDHLTTEHRKFFHTDINSHIVPFRFDSNLLQCVECAYQYHNFKILLEHMNKHYGNYICEVCEAGFVNKRMLQAHMYRHKIGVFECDYCPKVFNTRIKMKVHERIVHMYVKKRPKCNICGRKFNDFEKMIEHEANAHGLQREIKCEICSRMYTTERSFKIHQKFYCVADA